MAQGCSADDFHTLKFRGYVIIFQCIEAARRSVLAQLAVGPDADQSPPNASNSNAAAINAFV